MREYLNQPTEKLSNNFVKIKVIRATFSFLVTIAILIAVMYGNHLFIQASWINPTIYILIALTCLYAVWSIALEPRFQYKNWRHSADEDFLQIRSGGINRTYELVPMTKIQSVATHQGPLLRRYHAYSLTVQTIGSMHTIPALEAEAATALREQIALFAKVKEVE
ncbi:MAG TPA: PH domain-containing protein [Bacillota bacterium]|nr:PH domain-containing protein [Bacillota bacterium]